MAANYEVSKNMLFLKLRPKNNSTILPVNPKHLPIAS